MAHDRSSPREQTAERVTALSGELWSRLCQGDCRDPWQLGERRLEATRSPRERRESWVSRTLGRTRVYELNPRWFFYKELKALLEKALAALPVEEVKKHYSRTPTPAQGGQAAMEQITAKVDAWAKAGRSGREAPEVQAKAR
jgi:hypothetical protein